MTPDDRFGLSAAVIRREIEKQMKRPVAFRCERQYRYQTDGWETLISFSAQDCEVLARLSDDERGMALEEFGLRIVAPMVAKWRVKAGVSEEESATPEGCIAGWISEEA